MRFHDSSTNSSTFQGGFEGVLWFVTLGTGLRPAYYRANGRGRRRHARLRVHGEGALERVPQARVPGVAVAARATARGDRRAQRGSGRRRGAPIRLRAVDDRLA